MAVNVFPAPVAATAEAPRYPIAIRNVRAGTSASTSSPLNFRTQRNNFVPKGSYTVSLSSNGDVGNAVGSGSAGIASNDIRYSIYFADAKTGRPSSFVDYNSTTPGSGVVVLAKDSYVVGAGVQVNSANTELFYDIVLYPTDSPFTALPSITANRTSGGTSGVTNSGNMNFGTLLLGWDYDRDEVFMITGQASTQILSFWRRFTPTFFIYRYDSANEVWESKGWTSISAGTGSMPNGSGLIFSEYHSPMFFIKDNFLHQMTTTEIWRDASGNSWGWAKADLNTSGTTLTFQAGHSNTNFSIPSANLAGSSSRKLMFNWDKKLNKVVFAGGRNTSGTLSSSWNSRWIQWDIATDTLDYNILNSSTANPLIAGDNVEGSAIYNNGMPDAETGFSYGIAPNGPTAGYLGKRDRNGSYTGVSSTTIFYPYEFTAAGSRGQDELSTNNEIEYLPYGQMLVRNRCITKNHTGNNAVNFIRDNLGGSPVNILRGIWNGLTSNVSQSTALVKGDKGLYIASVAFGNLGSHRVLPVSIIKAPMSEEVLQSITPNLGGLPDASTTQPPGVNFGDGN